MAPINHAHEPRGKSSGGTGREGKDPNERRSLLLSPACTFRILSRARARACTCARAVRVCTSVRNASAYQREPECVAIANGLAGLDGPVINCVTRDYITDTADPLYYIRSYVRVAGGLRVTYVPPATRRCIRACLPDARGNALVRARNKLAATPGEGW